MGDRYLSSTRRIKIDASDLQVGMFIADLDRPWIESPFLMQGFLLETPEDLDTVRKICKYVYVDVAKSIRKAAERPKKKAGRVINAPLRASFENTFERSVDVYNRTHALVKSTMDDIRFGKAIDTGLAKIVVRECVEIIINNPNTMILLTQIRNKDEYTSQHSLNVCILSIVLGRFMGFSVARLEELGLCGLLHDMGKIKVPIEILNKEGRLTADEFEIMKGHTTLGRDILLSARDIPPSTVDVAYSHHERINGSGYPKGRTGENISPFAKMVSVVDTYDAITSDRVYKNGKSHLNALNILIKSRRTQFQSSVVINFIACLGVYPPGSIIEFQNDEVGIVFEVTAETKTKPKVLLVLDRMKKPRKERVLDLSQNPLDENGKLYQIKEVLRHGTYGIDLQWYIEKGLIMKSASRNSEPIE